MKRAGVFTDLDSARQFADWAQQEIARASSQEVATRSSFERANQLQLFSNAKMDAMANRFGGFTTTVARSSDRRELRAHDRKRRIHPQDRVYLSKRDSTGLTAVYRVPRDVWRRLPRDRSSDASTRRMFNDYLDELAHWHLPQYAWQAQALARRDGGAFLLRATTGEDLTEPLGPDEETRGFQVIPVHSVKEGDTAFTSDQTKTMPHGIETLAIERHNPETGNEERVDVHGERIVSFNESPDPTTVWDTPVLDVIHDDLWDWKDIIVSQRNMQIKGAPFVVKVDDEAGFHTRVPDSDVGDPNKDPLAAIDQEIQDYVGFDRDHFAPTEGVEFDRLDPADMELDPSLIRSIVSRMADTLDMPVTKLFRGFGEMSEFARDEYMDTIRAHQDHLGNVVMRQIIAQGQQMREVLRRPTFPPNPHWPDFLFYNERQRALTMSNEARAMRDLRQTERGPPQTVQEKYPETGLAPEAQPETGAQADVQETNNLNDSDLNEVRKVVEDVARQRGEFG